MRGQNPNGQNPNGQNPNGQNPNGQNPNRTKSQRTKSQPLVYLDLYMLFWFILLLTETQTVLTAFICAQQCNSSLHSHSEHCHPGSTFYHLVHCALSLGAKHTLLILMLLMFPLNLDGSNYR